MVLQWRGAWPGCSFFPEEMLFTALQIKWAQTGLEPVPEAMVNITGEEGPPDTSPHAVPGPPQTNFSAPQALKSTQAPACPPRVCLTLYCLSGSYWESEGSLSPPHPSSLPQPSVETVNAPLGDSELPESALVLGENLSERNMTTLAEEIV